MVQQVDIAVESSWTFMMVSKGQINILEFEKIWIDLENWSHR